MRRTVALLGLLALVACTAPPLADEAAPAPAPAPAPSPPQTTAAGRHDAEADSILAAIAGSFRLRGIAMRGSSPAAAQAQARGTVPVQLPPTERADGAARLRTYILATDIVSVPRPTLAAAVCAWRFALDVSLSEAPGPVARPAEVAATPDVNLLILPVREPLAAAAAPRAFADVYDHDRARLLLGAAGVRDDGLFIVTVSGPPLGATTDERTGGQGIVVETLTGWSPDLVHAWIRETRRRVREPGGWSAQSLRQRLLTVAHGLDMAGSFVGPFFQLVGVANAQGRAPPLPDGCG
ncbi:hypothetical protein [Elioraea sp.]|uniref:hypothetical protein n=1 Tax=Elioraea sp. TaxID=2185103 RepID=UPI0025BE4738|nr:hypothetical protein [Elioraea sp.]